MAGAGGYWHLHYIAKDASGKPVQPGWKVPNLGVVLEAYADSRHVLMRLEITPQTVHGDYITVPRPQEAWRTGPTQTADSFTLNLRSHKLVSVKASAKVGTTRRPPARPGKRG